MVDIQRYIEDKLKEGTVLPSALFQGIPHAQLVEAAVSWSVDKGRLEVATSKVADPPRYEARVVKRYTLSEAGRRAAERAERSRGGSDVPGT